MQDTFTILPYRPEWPEEFRQIAAQIRAALVTEALRIDHIGSTSVPGLCSKDVIDIQITVADLASVSLSPTMIRAGFQPRPIIRQDHVPPGEIETASEWEKRYFREPHGERETHIHVRRAGRRNQRYALLFRDYLRAHPPAARAYGQVKAQLAPKLQRTDYVDAKDPVCDLIIQAAEMWAAKSWVPAPADA